MPDLLRGLNPEQRDAVCHTEGPVLILAGAGSGKTRVITSRVGYLIAQKLALPGEILAVTFTNKAAEEMRERVAKITGGRAAREIVISTFHSFCLRVLREQIERLGYRRNFTICSESDTRTIVRRLLDDMDDVRERFSPDEFLGRIGLMKSTGAKHTAKSSDTPTKEKYETFMPEVYDRYQSALRAANTVDFDDILLLALRLWHEHPDVLRVYQQRFRYVMVDEYQDTNQTQYELLRLLSGGHRNLCVVGDDDQSIYGWRGASIANILDFERDFPEAKVIKLEQNYRSTENILNASNSVIANNKARRDKKLWSKLGTGYPIEWVIVADEEQEAKEVVERLTRIREQTGLGYEDFAVLYRSNLQSRPVEIAFRNAGIPYVVVGGQEFFDRAEVKDIISYLKVISNPRDEAAFLRIVNMPRRGIGDVTLHQVHELCLRDGVAFSTAIARLLEAGQATRQAEAGLRLFLHLLQDFRGRFKRREKSLAAIVNELVDAIDYRGELLRTCKSPGQMEARWSNVEAVTAAVAAYEKDAPSPTLSGFLDQSSLNTDEDRRSKQERRLTGVSLMTIHSAKGLEFPFVFLLGVEEGILPHEKSVRDGGIEEERRLFYVALTRAKRHVMLFEVMARNRNGRERMSATSRFVKEIPEDLLQRQLRAARDMVEDKVAPPKPVPKKKPRR